MLEILLAAVCVLVYLLLDKYSMRYDPPIIPHALPIIGHVHLGFRKDKFYENLKLLSDCCIASGGVAVAKIGPVKHYLIADPDDAITIANTCLKKPPYYGFFKGWLGNALFTAEPQTWKYHRKLLNPAFSNAVIIQFLGVFNSQARKLVQRFENHVGGPFNPGHHLSRITMETAFLTTLQSSLDDENVSQTYDHSTKLILSGVVSRFWKFWLHPQFLYNLTSAKKEEDSLIKTVVDISKKVLKQKKIELSLRKGKGLNQSPTDIECSSKFKPFLDLILELAEDKNKITDDEVINHLNTIAFGNYDTSLSTLKFILVILGSNQTPQEKIYKELQEVFGDEKRDIGKQDLSKLAYTEAFIKESIRLYTVAPLSGRITESEVKLKHYTLPRGSSVGIVNYALNVHPLWGSDAKQFRPERWLEPNGVPNNPNLQAMFSIGKRNCIGKRYAMLSLKILLVHIVRNFRVTSDITKMKIEIDVLMKPVSGYEIALELRP